MRTKLWRRILSGSLAALVLAGSQTGAAEKKTVPPEFQFPTVTGEEVWQPKREAAGTLSHNARIVSYADKWTRHEFGGHGGGPCRFRDSNSYFPFKSTKGKFGEPDPLYSIVQTVDVDGDGDTSDDFVMSLPFSLTESLNIEEWPRGAVFPNPLSWNFYGGMSWYVSDSSPGTKGIIQEMGINADHSTPWFDGRAEDHPLNGAADEKTPSSKLRMAMAFVWKKGDFLADGDKAKVTFDENSVLAGIAMRDYWFGFDDVRMIAMDGNQLYISDNQQFDIPKKAFRELKQGGRVFRLSPTKATWAKYNPDPHDFLFDESKATMTKHDFKDVQAVGIYFGKFKREGKLAHFKWYGFECDAVVTRKDYPSQSIDMVEVKSGGVPAFDIAVTEMPYLLHKRIYRWGDSPFHTLQARYVYQNRGDLGSMRYTLGEHDQNEPVANLSFYDMLAMCNTLSEIEGKEPCYYLDEEFTKIFRNQQYWRGVKGAGYERRNFENGKMVEIVKPAPVYVKWAATGHRLPTPAEWKAAYGKENNGWQKDNSGGQTHPVGTAAANANGLYDMAGNVWETVWTYGDHFDPATHKTMIVVGGDFLSPNAPEKHPASPYGDLPFNGAHNIGYRLVCRDKGQAAPPIGDPVKLEIPTWTIEIGKRIGGTPDAEPAQGLVETVSIPKGTFHYESVDDVRINAMEMGKTEVTFAQWEKVKQWGEAHEYRFSMHGDMGSSFYFAHTHQASEPVTALGWNDLLVWCNALSEMEGRTPCYYLDQEMTQVYRVSPFFRPIKLDGSEMVRPNPRNPGMPALREGNSSSTYNAQPFVFTRYDVEGYRLPSEAEHIYAAAGGTKRGSWWKDGSSPSKGGEGYKQYGWGFGNANGTTHPAGLKKPNAFGLYDILGNVYEQTFSLGKATKARDPKLDLDNPKRDPFPSFGCDKKYNVTAHRQRACGSSWLWGPMAIQETGADRLSPGAFHYYSDIGFRVLRCDKKIKTIVDGKEVLTNGHVRDGKEKLAEEPVILDLTGKTYNPAQGQVWRGNNKRTGVWASTAPRTKPETLWTFETGGPVSSSPLAFEGKVYVGTHDGLVCIDAQSGKKVWLYSVAGGCKSSPGILNGVVYVGSEDKKLHAVNAETGEKVWTCSANNKVASSVALGYGLAWIGNAQGVDLATGKIVWDTQFQKKGAVLFVRNDGTFASPSLAEKHLIFPGFAGAAIEISRCKGNGSTWEGENTCALDDGVIYSINSAAGGNLKPATFQSKKYVGGSGTTLDGHILTKDVSVRTIALSSPAVWKGHVIACNDGGELVILSTKGRGKRLFDVQLDGAIRSSPSVSEDGVIIVGSNGSGKGGFINAIDVQTGEVLWRVPAGDKVESSACLANGVIYIGSHDGKVYALAGKDAALKKD